MFNKRMVLTALLSFIPITASASLYLTAAGAYTSTKSGNVTYQGFGPKFGLGIDNDTPMINPGRLYIAAEVTAMPFRSFTINDNSTSGATSLKSEWTYAANVMPGVILDAVLKAYFILGLDRTSFSAGISTGRQAGVGVEYKINPHWGARLNYIYTSYSSLTELNSPRRDEGNLTVVYRFMSQYH